MLGVPTRLSAVLVALVAALSLSVVAPSSASDTTLARSSTSVRGTWKGLVTDGSATYHARVRIFKRNGKLHGRIHYPDAPTCTGIWVYRRTENGWRHFVEKITIDPGKTSCVQRLHVKVKRRDARLRVVWTYHARTARMLAHRV